MDIEKKGILRLLAESWDYFMRDKKYTLKVVLLVTMVNFVFILLIDRYLSGYNTIYVLKSFVHFWFGLLPLKGLIMMAFSRLVSNNVPPITVIDFLLQFLYLFVYIFVLLMPIVSIVERANLNSERQIGKSISYAIVTMVIISCLSFAMIFLFVCIMDYLLGFSFLNGIIILAIFFIIMVVVYFLFLLTLKLFKYVYIVDGYPIGRAVSRFRHIVWKREIFKYIVYICIFYVVFIGYNILIGRMVIAFKCQSCLLYYIGLLILFTFGFSAFEVFNGIVGYVFYRYLSSRAGVDNALTDG